MVYDAGYLRESLEQEICRVRKDCVLILSWAVMQAILAILRARNRLVRTDFDVIFLRSVV